MDRSGIAGTAIKRRNEYVCEQNKSEKRIEKMRDEQEKWTGRERCESNQIPSPLLIIIIIIRVAAIVIITS